MKEITHDLNHDLTFSAHCVPQYKVNVLGIYNFGPELSYKEQTTLAVLTHSLLIEPIKNEYI